MCVEIARAGTSVVIRVANTERSILNDVVVLEQGQEIEEKNPIFAPFKIQGCDGGTIPRRGKSMSKQSVSQQRWFS